LPAKLPDGGCLHIRNVVTSKTEEISPGLSFWTISDRHSGLVGSLLVNAWLAHENDDYILVEDIMWVVVYEFVRCFENKIGWTGNDGDTSNRAPDRPTEDCEDVKAPTRQRTSLTTSTTTSAPIDETLDVLFTVSKLCYLSVPAPVKDIVIVCGILAPITLGFC